MKTLADLKNRAQTAIDRKEAFIYDVAAETGQIVGNVSHMRWFLKAVMRWLAENTATYRHLEVPNER